MSKTWADSLVQQIEGLCLKDSFDKSVDTLCTERGLGLQVKANSYISTAQIQELHDVHIY